MKMNKDLEIKLGIAERNLLNMQESYRRVCHKLEEKQELIAELEEIMDIGVSDYRWATVRDILNLLVVDYKGTDRIKQWLKETNEEEDDE